MKAKEFCLSKMPNLRAEKHTYGSAGFKRIYWLIRKIDNRMLFAEGKSESNAWANAKKYILERESETE